MKTACDLLWNANANKRLQTKNGCVQFETCRPLYPSRTTIYRYAGINVRQIAMKHEDLYCMSEIIVKTESSYVHYITIWSGTYPQLIDTTSDEYHYYDLSGQNKFIVELEEVHGIMCYKIGEHIVLLLDQYKNSLDAVPTIISQGSENLLTLDLVEKYMMEDENYQAVLEDINHYHTTIDFPDTEEIADKRMEGLGTPRNLPDVLDIEPECDDYESADDEIANLNATVAGSFISPITGGEDSIVDYISETDSSEDTRDGVYDEDSISSYEETTMASTLDNPLYPSSEIVNMVKDDNIMMLTGKKLKGARRELKYHRIEGKQYCFSLKMFPDMPSDLKNSFHHESETILHMLEDVEDYYQCSQRYFSFKSYVLNALKLHYGTEMLQRTRIAVMARRESNLFSSDSSDSDGSYYEGDWYHMR
jgi:hypothetical protein